MFNFLVSRLLCSEKPPHISIGEIDVGWCHIYWFAFIIFVVNGFYSGCHFDWTICKYNTISVSFFPNTNLCDTCTLYVILHVCTSTLTDCHTDSGSEQNEQIMNKCMSRSICFRFSLTFREKLIEIIFNQIWIICNSMHNLPSWQAFRVIINPQRQKREYPCDPAHPISTSRPN